MTKLPEDVVKRIEQESDEYRQRMQVRKCEESDSVFGHHAFTFCACGLGTARKTGALVEALRAQVLFNCVADMLETALSVEQKIDEHKSYTYAELKQSFEPLAKQMQTLESMLDDYRGNGASDGL